MKLRVARHVNSIRAMVEFYVEKLGLEQVGYFNHEGYEGLILSKGDAAWQLEFTVSDDKANCISGEDDLIVIYYDTKKEFEDAIKLLNASRQIEFAPLNPYWEIHGKLYKDPEGARVVLVDPSTY